MQGGIVMSKFDYEKFDYEQAKEEVKNSIKNLTFYYVEQRVLEKVAL